MRRPIHSIALVLLAFQSGMAATLTPPKAVQQRLATVLNAHLQVKHEGESAATRDALESALSPILVDRSATGDETLAVLLGFYIGEHPSEDISCELVSRGRPVLKYLKKYESAQVVVPGVSPEALEPIKTEYPIVIGRIQAGERCAREP